MGKIEVGSGFVVGLFFGIWLKTGIDASPDGIAIMILQALGPTMIGFPTQSVISFVSITSIIALIIQLRNNLVFLVGFMLGIFAVWISY